MTAHSSVDPCLLKTLPDESVFEVARWLTTKELVLFGRTCRRIRSNLLRPSVVPTLVEDRCITKSIAEKIKTIQVLGAWEMLNEAGMFGENRIGFAKASAGIEENVDDEIICSRSRVETARKMLKQFPSCKVVVDAHCGTLAPWGIAMQFSRIRAVVVGDIIRERNESGGRVAEERVVLHRWGRLVADLASESSHPYGKLARKGFGWVEIYVEIDDVEMPARPPFYTRLSVLL